MDKKAKCRKCRYYRKLDWYGNHEYCTFTKPDDDPVFGTNGKYVQWVTEIATAMEHCQGRYFEGRDTTDRCDYAKLDWESIVTKVAIILLIVLCIAAAAYKAHWKCDMQQRVQRLEQRIDSLEDSVENLIR